MHSALGFGRFMILGGSALWVLACGDDATTEDDETTYVTWSGSEANDSTQSSGSGSSSSSSTTSADTGTGSGTGTSSSGSSTGSGSTSTGSTSTGGTSSGGTEDSSTSTETSGDPGSSGPGGEEGSETGPPAECEDPTWWNTDFTHRVQLEIDNSIAAQPIQNFPVLVRLHPSWFDYDAASPTGDDLRFRSEAGTFALNYEIDHWEPGGVSAIWVEYPELPLGDGPTAGLWLYYGNPEAAPASDGPDVFGRFAMVNHLSTELLDSVAHRDAVTPEGFGTPAACTDDCEPLVGEAQSFNAAEDDALELTDSETMTFWGNEVRLSVSFWLRTTEIDRVNGWTPIVSKAESAWRIQQHANNTWPSFDFDCIQDTAGMPTCGPEVDAYGNYHVPASTGNYADGDWHHVAVSVDYPVGARWGPIDRPFIVRIYFDGTLRNEVTFAGSLEYTTETPPPAALFNYEPNVPITLAMKADQPTGAFFHGDIDELRMSEEGLSASWYGAEYRIVRGNALTVRTPETCPPVAQE